MTHPSNVIRILYCSHRSPESAGLIAEEIYKDFDISCFDWNRIDSINYEYDPEDYDIVFLEIPVQMPHELAESRINTIKHHAAVIRVHDSAYQKKVMQMCKGNTHLIIDNTLAQDQIIAIIHMLAHMKGNVSGGVPWVADALRESEQRYRQIVLAMAGWIWECGTDWIVTYSSENVKEYLGYDAEEITGRSIFSLLDEKCREEVATQLLEAAESESPIRDLEFWIDTAEGGLICVLISAEVKRNTHGILSGFRCVGKDITTQKTAEAALHRSNERLRELDKLKSEFLSTVSHELRTPIAIMGEGVALCLEEIVGPLNHKQRDLLEDTHQNVDRLSRLISDLLDISKIEAGRVVLRKVQFNIPSIIQQALDGFSSVAGQKNLEMRYEGPLSLIIYADPDKVRQIIDNLISNAIRFTAEGSITIILEDESEIVRCRVCDTGIGISKKDVKGLFVKFAQIGRVDGPGYKGTGLGLAIVKGLVEKHNGAISVESVPDQGSCFSFTLARMTPPGIGIVDYERQRLLSIQSTLKQSGYLTQIADTLNANEICKGIQLLAVAYNQEVDQWLEKETAFVESILIYDAGSLPEEHVLRLERWPNVTVAHNSDARRLHTRIQDLLMG
ncbi:PAS domain S-box protein [bacterium]|nr:PAS domain S-box protein [bacterium]